MSKEIISLSLSATPENLVEISVLYFSFSSSLSSLVCLLPASSHLSFILQVEHDKNIRNSLVHDSNGLPGLISCSEQWHWEMLIRVSAPTWVLLQPIPLVASQKPELLYE